MFVKVMSGEELHDSDPKKCYNLYADIDIMNLSRDEEGNPEVELINGGTIVTIKPMGNVYSLGDMGLPIAFFAVKEDELCYNPDEIGLS